MFDTNSNYNAFDVILQFSPIITQYFSHPEERNSNVIFMCCVIY